MAEILTIEYKKNGVVTRKLVYETRGKIFYLQDSEKEIEGLNERWKLTFAQEFNNSQYARTALWVEL